MSLIKIVLLNINQGIQRIEKVTLCLLFLFLISGSLLQIVLRTFFDTGLIWIDPLLRASLIFITMIGSCIAITQKKHIQIDFFKFLVPMRFSRLTHKFIALLCAALCFFTSFLAYLFVKTEMEYSDAFVLNIKMYHIQLAFPTCFLLMSYHFLCELFMPDPENT